MIDVNELRKGVTFEQDNNIFKVIEYEHHKPGRGKATIKIKARNLRTGSVIDKSFNSGDRVQQIRLDHQMVQFLYSDGEYYHFMNLETYEQPPIRAEIIGDASYYLVENIEAKLTFYNGQAIDISLPTTVDLEVIDAGTAVRGDTATGLTKKVVTQTNLDVQVPAFINKGDIIRVDTRSGTYVSRV